MIALTGFADADMRKGCLAAGFDAHLVKPGENATLAELLGGNRADTDSASG
jgi:CheY-like chemotaxis protein